MNKVPLAPSLLPETSEAAADLELPSQHLLQHIMDLLKKFTYQFPTVIAQVARKTDAAFWKLIFSQAGSAISLFEVRPLSLPHSKPIIFQQAVSSGQLMTAASFLRIILVLEGEKAARKAAVKVLEMALERDDLSLIADLMRFLEPTRYQVECPRPLSKAPLLPSRH